MSKSKTALICVIFSLICVISIYAQEQFDYNEQGRRNPFIPLVTPDGRLLNLDKKEGEKAILNIEGIIYDKNGVSYAVVNGEVVKVGDKISDYQVLRIQQNKIIFIKEGEPMEVELKKEEESENPKN